MPILPCGHEVSDANQVHYCSYLRIPELAGLQPQEDQLKHHDELLFIITHQAFELWFKQILHELAAATRLLGADNVGYATWLMRRVSQIVRLLIEQIHITETMAPQDFFAFRAALSPASGTESLQYREIEIRSGLRDTARYRPALEAAPGPPGSESPQTRVLTAGLAAAWEQPSLHDAFMGLLDRRSVTVEQVYAPLDRSHHHDLFLLAETLLEYISCSTSGAPITGSWWSARCRMPPKAPATPPACATLTALLPIHTSFPNSGPHAQHCGSRSVKTKSQGLRTRAESRRPRNGCRATSVLFFED